MVVGTAIADTIARMATCSAASWMVIAKTVATDTNVAVWVHSYILYWDDLPNQDYMC